MPMPSASPGLSLVPGDVLAAMEIIHKAGFDVWVVGGALRDFLLGVEPKDWDLATSASTGKINSLFPRVIPVGIRHGTVQVHTRTRDIEVTSFEPSGQAGILKDLGRRDFTINSLALSYPDGILVDPNGGREDLTAGLIRAVGNPGDRFSEDPLRIVRAARMRAIYGFEVDAGTFAAMREWSGKLENVSGERIRDEILKILPARDISGAFGLLRKSGALGKLLPGLDEDLHAPAHTGSGVGIYEHTLSCIVNSPERIRVRLAALFHQMALPAVKAAADGPPSDFRRESSLSASVTMKSWNMSNRSIDEVSSLVLHQLSLEAISWSDIRIRRFLTTVNPALLEDFTALAEAEILSEGCPGTSEETQSGIEGIRRLGDRMRVQLERLSASSVRELALSGDDIIKILDIPPGPEVGKVLKHLFDLVLENPDINTRERLSRIVEAEKNK
jgi:tRNA nucleotidyltransferase (CCA-adding enzyme)